MHFGPHVDQPRDAVMQAVDPFGRRLPRARRDPPRGEGPCGRPSSVTIKCEANSCSMRSTASAAFCASMLVQKLTRGAGAFASGGWLTISSQPLGLCSIEAVRTIMSAFNSGDGRECMSGLTEEKKGSNGT
jgi:hypothetical protein